VLILEVSWSKAYREIYSATEDFSILSILSAVFVMLVLFLILLQCLYGYVEGIKSLCGGNASQITKESDATCEYLRKNKRKMAITMNSH
jgi:hypothetical protein